MNLKRFSLFSILLTLPLTSCGANSDNVHVLKNGELNVLSELTYDNVYVEATYSYMKNMLQGQENFIFYLTSNTCSHCLEFKSKMLEYVKASHSLVVKMEVYLEDEKTPNPEFEQFYNNYKEQFFVNGEINTPQVYVANGENVATFVPSSRYSTATMFKTAMNDYVYTCNVSTFSTLKAYNDFKSKHLNDGFLTILIERSNQNLIKIYKNQIDQLIKNSKKDIALVEINDNNKNDFYSLFELQDLNYPFGNYQKNDITDRYTFNSNENEGINFLKKYI